MERRNFLKLPLAAGAGILAANTLGIQSATAATSTALSTPAVGLKGFGYNVKDSLTLAQFNNLNLDWYYAWNAAPNKGPANNFIPMIWSDGTNMDANIKKVMDQLSLTGTKHLLGFNEPDFAEQANMTTGEAVAAWAKLEATGLRLGSPATIKPNAWWMDTFMTKAKAANLRIDFVTMHCYGWPNADDFLRKVDTLHEKWGLPVWVTEYAVADFSASASVPNRYGRTQVNEFMQATVEGMRARPYVERFAWKTRASTDPVMGTSALFDSRGWRTSTGHLWSSL